METQEIKKTLSSHLGLLCAQLGRIPESKGIIMKRIIGLPLSKLVICVLLYSLPFYLITRDQCERVGQKGIAEKWQGSTSLRLFQSSDSVGLAMSCLLVLRQLFRWTGHVAVWQRGHVCLFRWRCQQAHQAFLPPFILIVLSFLFPSLTHLNIWAPVVCSADCSLERQSHQRDSYGHYLCWTSLLVGEINIKRVNNYLRDLLV